MTTTSKPEWAQSKRERANAERLAQGLPPRRRRWPWIVLLVLVIAGGAAGYLYLTRPVAPESAATAAPAADPAAGAMQLTEGEIGAVERERVVERVKVTGSLAARRQTQISAEVAGSIEAVAVRPGDSVQEGDVLVEFDTEALELQLQQQRANAEATRAQLALAELELERTRSLIERDVGAASLLDQKQATADQLRATLAGLEAQVEAAENALDHATVRAPFSGTVSERSADPGQTVTAGAPLLTLVDLAELEFEAGAPIGSIPAVTPGQEVVISVEGIAERTFDGVVERISPVALEGTRTLPVYISLDNGDGMLRGGMFATGQIVVDAKENAFAVPADAIREDRQGEYVLKIEGERVVRQPVEVGRRWDNGRAEIASGLSAGDRIVTAILPELEADTAIEIVEG